MPGDTDHTTITVREETKERLDAHRDGRTWDHYLEKLRREHADPITLNDVDELGDRLAEELGSVSGGGSGNDPSPVTLEATEYTKIAKEVVEALQ